jgi:hypothetical protein
MSSLAVLNGQPFSPFGPAFVNNPSALLGGHPFQKPMGSGTLNSAGLICSFHYCNPLLETFEKCSFLFKFKEGKIFNHRNTLSILMIKI